MYQLQMLMVLVDHLQKNKERIQKFKETGDSRYIYQNELDKACFYHYMVYGDFKDLNRRTTSDKILHYKVFNTAKYDEYQKGITSMIYQFFDKKNENISNKELADELHKPIIRKLKKKKRYTHLLQKIFEVLILQICNQ